MALDVLVVFKSQPRHFCIIEILSPPYLELLASLVIWDFIGLLEENQSGCLATMKGRFTFSQMILRNQHQINLETVLWIVFRRCRRKGAICAFFGTVMSGARQCFCLCRCLAKKTRGFFPNFCWGTKILTFTSSNTNIHRVVRWLSASPILPKGTNKAIPEVDGLAAADFWWCGICRFRRENAAFAYF